MGNGLFIEEYVPFTVYDWLDAHLGRVASSVGSKLRWDDDIIDRLSHRHTCIILLFFTVFLYSNQYFGERIECWPPADFEDWHADYVKEVCWVSNTYYIPFGERIPRNEEARKERQIKYYQWSPLILLTMFFMFKIPRMIWKWLSARTLSLDHLMTTLSKCNFKKRDDREKQVDDIVDYLDDYMRTMTPFHRNCCYSIRMTLSRYMCIVCGRRYGNFFLTAALITKCLYFMNVIGIFFVLNSFLSAEFSVFGIDALKGLVTANPQKIQTSLRFPSITLCDMKFRQLSNVQTTTVQCVLPINIYNEKIFIFLWFWFLLVAIFTGIGLLRCMYNFFLKPRKVFLIKKHLKLHGEYPPKTGKMAMKALITKFQMEYLKYDGIFVLELAVKNSSDVLVGDIIVKLWKRFYERENHEVQGNGDIH
ncbi:hypothetical protein ACJMK2_014322 [Sinanodonta woodiana]|uniref:Innexin n=1 Tax=Sinanodonta woodiana TaxID=1069815 RepID=A0ABD3V0B9_SINWO